MNRETPLGPWLCRTAVWTVNNLRRRQSTRRVETLNHEPATPTATATFELAELLAALPEKYRTPIVLCHVQGWSRREAARELGLAEGTLSAILHRGLNRLRARFGSDPVTPLAVMATVSVPGPLMANCFELIQSHRLATALPSSVVALSQGVLRMFWVKKVVTSGIAVCLTTVGVVGWALVPGQQAEAVTPPVTMAAAVHPHGFVHTELMQSCTVCHQDVAPKPPQKMTTDPESTLKLLRAQQEQAQLRVETAKVLLEAAEVEYRKAVADRLMDVPNYMTEERIEIGFADPKRGQGDFYYAEFQGRKRTTLATLGEASDLTVLLKRAVADPKSPKLIRVIMSRMPGATIPPRELVNSISLVNALLAAGVDDVNFCGLIPDEVKYEIQGTETNRLKPESQGTSFAMTTSRKRIQAMTAKFVDGSKPIKLSKLFPADFRDVVLASIQQRLLIANPEEVAKIFAYSKTVSILQVNSNGTVNLTLDPTSDLKVGDILPAYQHRGTGKDRVLEMTAKLRVIEINGQAAAAIIANDLNEFPKRSIHESDWLGPAVRSEAPGR